MNEIRTLSISIVEGYDLSRLTRGDKPALLQHLAEEEISRNTLRIPFPYTEADADQWLDRCEMRACDPEKLFAIREETGFLIGTIGIAEELPAGATSAEFGYWPAKPYWGRGLMSRAISVFADYAGRRLKLEQLHAIPFITNMGSQRALEKAGFEREAFLPKHFLKNGVYIDSVRYRRVVKRDAST